MDINFEKLNKEYEELARDIDELALIVEGLLHRSHAIEQILDHHSLEATGENEYVDL